MTAIPAVRQTERPATPAGEAGQPAGRPLWRVALGVMFNPGSVVEAAVGKSPVGALAISGAAFALFFFQTGLDVARQTGAGMGAAGVLAAIGAVYGTLGMAVIALVAWVLCLPFKSGHSPLWAMRAFGVAYSPALVYALLGLPFNLLLGWNTALSFGVTGVLWAFSPTMSTLKSMTNGSLGASALYATITGGLLLFGWSFLGAGR